MLADTSPDFELDSGFFWGCRDSVDSTLSSLWLGFCFRFKNEGTLKAPFTMIFPLSELELYVNIFDLSFVGCFQAFLAY